jgi:hypothetical protein
MHFFYRGQHLVGSRMINLGWLVKYTGSSGKATNLMSEGLMEKTDMLASEMRITSSSSAQSMLWLGTFGEVSVKKVITFDANDAFLHIAVYVKNIGPVTLKDFYCK